MFSDGIMTVSAGRVSVVDSTTQQQVASSRPPAQTLARLDAGEELEVGQFIVEIQARTNRDSTDVVAVAGPKENHRNV